MKRIGRRGVTLVGENLPNDTLTHLCNYTQPETLANSNPAPKVRNVIAQGTALGHRG
jgi:hypothetical protein